MLQSRRKFRYRFQWIREQEQGLKFAGKRRKSRQLIVRARKTVKTGRKFRKPCYVIVVKVESLKTEGKRRKSGQTIPHAC
jgi:hypothetical protein